MRVTRNWAYKLVLTTTAVMLSVAMMSCCKKKKDTEEEPSAVPTETAEPETPVPSAEGDWKTKCPGAEKEENGSVQLVRASQVYKERDVTSEKLQKLDTGTWVNLLGSVETWTCIDYPCAPGKLCPGWIETRDVQRVAADTKVDTTKDAGKPDGVVSDAGKSDLSQDSSTPPAASSGENRGRFPGLLLGKDGGLLRPGRPKLRGETREE